MCILRLPKEWVEKAEFLLSDAKRHLEDGVYWMVCFESQQAVELYLKATIVSLTGLHPYTHDLVELLDSIKDLGFEVLEELYTYADALTPHYTMSRYPGRKPVTYNRKLAERCIKYAEEITRWIKKKIAEI